MASSSPPVKVLVVCLGNICRSPMGEAVLKDIATKRGLEIEVDSCGTTSFHAGGDPDDRTVSTCERHNVPISHVARQISISDFTNFSHILAADATNLRDLQRIKPRNATADLRLWGSYFDGKPIQDPYWGGDDGFEQVFRQCVLLSNAFLDDVLGTLVANA